ncbi:MAG TPA: ProQ/FinO family protein [Gammaproteobacteria bacterium]|jgi:ProP effector|nr:ProQ/FinO family protein [Gammaproteobacteria bacterium]
MMGGNSLKEQLEALASQLTSVKLNKEETPKKPEERQDAKKVSRQQSRGKSKSKPKPQWLDYVLYGVELLKSYFPAAFKPASQVMPLKKGIKQDLVKRLSTIEQITIEDKACMVKSLSYYVNTIAYHRCVVLGIMRVDLDGQPVAPVSAEEAQYSQTRIQAKQQKPKSP